MVHPSTPEHRSYREGSLLNWYLPSCIEPLTPQAREASDILKCLPSAPESLEQRPRATLPTQLPCRRVCWALGRTGHVRGDGGYVPRSTEGATCWVDDLGTVLGEFGVVGFNPPNWPSRDGAGVERCEGGTEWTGNGWRLLTVGPWETSVC